MPYGGGNRLPGEKASKLGHLAVVGSDWVQELVREFESPELTEADPSDTVWERFDPAGIEPLRSVWSVDGSFITVKSEQKPPKEVTFVKTALLTIDRDRLERIDKSHPHPLHLQDIMADSAVFHSTVFPLKNVRFRRGSNLEAIRNIVWESFHKDESGAFFETLKWIAYQKWSKAKPASPAFECPCCGNQLDQGLPYDSDEGTCSHPGCGERLMLTDMIGFHLGMSEDSADESVASSYMLVMEHIMLFTAIRLLWSNRDRSLVSDTLFLKDGPLTLRSQYSKLVPNIRLFLQHAKDIGRPIHIAGQEKSGTFFDHLASIVRFPAPHARGEPASYAVLSHNYVRKEVHRAPERSNPYGMRTNWGEKLYVKLDPGSWMVLNVPTGEYQDRGDFPEGLDLIGLPRILATLPSLVSHKFEGAMFPIELANGVASMSSYPSAQILQKFLDDTAG